MKKSNLMTSMAVFLASCMAVIPGCGLLNGGGGSGPRTIVFSAKNENNGTYQIYTMREDGSGVRKLTHSSYSSTAPTWSPDGRRIAYAAYSPDLGGDELWVMDADGKNKQPLMTHSETGNPVIGSYPAWSPDGNHIVFEQCQNCERGGNNYEIFIADLQSGAVDTLTDYFGADHQPTWSPDGSYVAFASDRDYPGEYGFELYAVEMNRNNELTRLTNTGNAGRLVWLPEDDKFLFWSNNNLYQSKVIDQEVIQLNMNLRHSTGFRPLDASPEGTKVLLHTFSYDEPSQKHSLEVLDLTNDQIKKIASFPKLYGSADWKKYELY